MLKQGIGFLARCFHLLINYNIVASIKKGKDYFYSQWIRCEFARCGHHCFFQGFQLLTGAKYIHLGDNLYIGHDTIWEITDKYMGQSFSPYFSCGDNCGFGDQGHIFCCNCIKIGNGVCIGRDVVISDNSHGDTKDENLDNPPHKRQLLSKGPVIIEDNVWIGEKACVLPGVIIGRGSIIGAHSVVTKDIPPYSLAVGNPAQVIKTMKQ